MRNTLEQERHLTGITSLIENALKKAKQAADCGQVCPLQQSLCREIETLLEGAALMASEARYWKEPEHA